MRDSPGTRTVPRPRGKLMGLLLAASIACASFVLPEAGEAKANDRPKATTLSLKSSLSKRLKRAQLAGSVLPFTVRLRRSYEGGPGDDVVALSWDPSAVPWPLAGTAPAAGDATTNLDGAFSYQWDYSADTSGYATLGTVETHVGGGVAMTGTGFGIAAPEGSTCTTLASLDATGVSFSSAGARFGTVNPFSGEVSGTIALRTAIRSRAVPCGGDPATAPTAVARGDGSEPPLPVAFTGRFTVSPSVTSDGRVRLGVLRIADTAATPQRSTFGLVNVCTDPTAVDGCDRRRFPVRTKLVSMTADVLAGDAMPTAPSDPPEPPSQVSLAVQAAV